MCEAERVRGPVEEALERFHRHIGADAAGLIERRGEQGGRAPGHLTFEVFPRPRDPDRQTRGNRGSGHNDGRTEGSGVEAELATLATYYGSAVGGVRRCGWGRDLGQVTAG